MEAKGIQFVNSTSNAIFVSFQPTEDANTPTEGIELAPWGQINHAVQSSTANLFIMDSDNRFIVWKGAVPTINKIVYDGTNVTIQSKIVPQGFNPITNLDQYDNKSLTSEDSFSLWWLLLIALLVIAAVGLWHMIG